MVVGVLLAGHRSGFIALFFIFCLWHLKSEHPKIDYMFIPLWAGAFFVFALFILSTTHITAGKSFLGDTALRFKDTFNLENQTTTHRLEMWEYSLDAVREKPLIGVGSFPAYLISNSDEGDSLPTSQTELDIPPHNLFVDKLIHEGIIGLGLLIILFYIVYKQIRIISIANRAYGNFFMAYFFAFLLFSFFNTTFSNPIGKIYFFTILGFLNSESLKFIFNSDYEKPVHEMRG
jgi:O-antigen ligase